MGTWSPVAGPHIAGIVGRRVNCSRHGMHALPNLLRRGPFLREGPWAIPEAEFLRSGRPRGSASWGLAFLTRGTGCGL
jgi:hypothetical protein